MHIYTYAGRNDNHILSLECSGQGRNEMQHIIVDFPNTTKDSLSTAASADAGKLEILLNSHARYRSASSSFCGSDR